MLADIEFDWNVGDSAKLIAGLSPPLAVVRVFGEIASVEVAWFDLAQTMHTATLPVDSLLKLDRAVARTVTGGWSETSAEPG